MLSKTFLQLCDDELLLQKCIQQLSFHIVHLTDVSTDCNNKFHTFLRNVSEWTFLEWLNWITNGVKRVVGAAWPDWNGNYSRRPLSCYTPVQPALIFTFFYCQRIPRSFADRPASGRTTLVFGKELMVKHRKPLSNQPLSALHARDHLVEIRDS